MIEKNKATTIHVALKDSSGDFVVGPTLAAGDVKRSIDGGTFANMDTLPSVEPSGSTNVKVPLSAAEVNCTSLSILFSDVAGSEWVDLRIDITPELAAVDQVVGSSKTVKQVLGYSAAVLQGTISNAGNSTETFTFDGYVVTVTVDSNGNRSAVLYTNP